MTPHPNAVYFLAARRNEEGTQLKFVEELAPEEEYSWSNHGMFVFLRHNNNRGASRELEFPAIVGFGDNSRSLIVKLRSLFPERGNANRFICEPLEGVEFIQTIEFKARKVAKPVELQGTAISLCDYSIWQLVPSDGEMLEKHWRENKFYFLGKGNGDVEG